MLLLEGREKKGRSFSSVKILMHLGFCLTGATGPSRFTGVVDTVVCNEYVLCPLIKESNAGTSYNLQSIRIINRSTNVGVSRTVLSLDNYHRQVIVLVKQITVVPLLLVR